MLYMIAMTYLLLCVRLRVRLEVSFEDGQGYAAYSAGALGVYFRRSFILAWDPDSFAIRAKPRREKKRRRPERRHGDYGGVLRHYLISVLQERRFERIVLHLRLGLGDACATAVCVGAVHAAVCALLATAGNLMVCDLRVTPDFARIELRAYLQGIFSCQLGDIMLAALKQARRKRKEGLKWTSIPLRA